MSGGLSLRRSNSEECLKDCRSGREILRTVSRIAAPGGVQIPRGLARLDQPVTLGGSAKEKPSRVWGGSGVGAELRFEQCLEDFGLGGQIT